ncbi:MAG: M23 family peptidase, partial [Thermomonas sp.]
MRSERSSSPLRGLLLFLLGGLVGANAIYFLVSRDANSPTPVASGPAASPGIQTSEQTAPLESEGADTAQHQAGPILPPPVARINGTANGRGSTPLAAQAQSTGTGLLLPVQGITPSQLSDTFTDARSAGRSHEAIDIMAAAGTPVLAV